jgi:anti-anti-sigma factor
MLIFTAVLAVWLLRSEAVNRKRFAGLNALVGADRQARADGGEVRLVIVAQAIARIVALTGVDHVIPIFASLEDALT